MSDTKTAETFNYEASQLNRLEHADFYRMQIRSDNRGETKWLNIDNEQLAAIRAILTGESPLAKVRKVAQDIRDEAAGIVEHDTGLDVYDTTTAAWSAQLDTADVILRAIDES